MFSSGVAMQPTAGELIHPATANRVQVLRRAIIRALHRTEAIHSPVLSGVPPPLTVQQPRPAAAAAPTVARAVLVAAAAPTVDRAVLVAAAVPTVDRAHQVTVPVAP